MNRIIEVLQLPSKEAKENCHVDFVFKTKCLNTFMGQFFKKYLFNRTFFSIQPITNEAYGQSASNTIDGIKEKLLFVRAFEKFPLEKSFKLYFH